MDKNNKVSRRQFMKFAGLVAGGAALSACTPQVVTQIVKETVVSVQTQVVAQTSVVKQTSIVKETSVVQVTPTTPPLIKTSQGRELPADAAPLEKQFVHEGFAEPKFLDTVRDIYSAQFAINNLGEPLLRNNENMETVPALAESWKAGDKAIYWEFKIREGAKWQDGQPITADDVVYTYWHLSLPQLANPWVWFYYPIKGIQAHFTGTLKEGDMVGGKKIDDSTVQVYGELGSCPFLPALVSYQASNIVPKHVAEANPEHWADTLDTFISAGPYICTKWEHNKSALLELNPMYNGPHKPGIVQDRLLTVSATELMPFMNKEVELVSGLSPAGVAQVRASSELNPLLHFFNNFQAEYIAFDTMKPPLDKKEVRQALAHAVDRETFCVTVQNGTKVPGYSMLPPGFPAYNKDIKTYQAFDVEKAKALLKTGGYDDPSKLSITLTSSGRDAYMEYVQAQWTTNLGIKVDIKPVDAGVWGQMRADHAFQAFHGAYEYDYVDPNNMLTMLWRSVPAPKGKEEPWGSPRHAWKSDAFDTLCDQAAVEGDVAKRMGMYQDAEKILVDEAAATFMTHNVIFQIWWPYLTGLPADKAGNVVYRWLDITRFQYYIRNDVDKWGRKD